MTARTPRRHWTERVSSWTLVNVWSSRSPKRALYLAERGEGHVKLEWKARYLNQTHRNVRRPYTRHETKLPRPALVRARLATLKTSLVLGRLGALPEGDFRGFAAELQRMLDKGLH